MALLKHSKGAVKREMNKLYCTFSEEKVVLRVVLTGLRCVMECNILTLFEASFWVLCLLLL